MNAKTHIVASIQLILQAFTIYGSDNYSSYYDRDIDFYHHRNHYDMYNPYDYYNKPDSYYADDVDFYDEISDLYSAAQDFYGQSIDFYGREMDLYNKELDSYNKDIDLYRHHDFYDNYYSQDSYTHDNYNFYDSYTHGSNKHKKHSKKDLYQLSPYKKDKKEHRDFNYNIDILVKNINKNLKMITKWDQIIDEAKKLRLDNRFIEDLKNLSPKNKKRFKQIINEIMLS